MHVWCIQVTPKEDSTAPKDDSSIDVLLVLLSSHYQASGHRAETTLSMFLLCLEDVFVGFSSDSPQALNCCS